MARDLSLADVERDTRIGQRFLHALEVEDLAAFPTLRQARAFLGLYARHLGLDVAEMLALVPETATPETSDMLVQSERILRERLPARDPILPRIDPHSPVLRWLALVAGVIVLCGALSAWGASGRERAIAGLTLGAQGGTARAFVVPDVRSEDLPGALRLMEQAGITPLVIEAPSAQAPAGQVVRQSPAPGTVVLDGADVTVIVSSGR